MTSYKLYYFNITGLGEAIRLTLHYGGAKFEDIRYEFDEWSKHKSEMPMKQVPVLEFNGKKYHQSKAILRYLAKKFNIYGSNDVEALEIDSALDTMDDLRFAVASYHFEKDPALKEKLRKTADEKLPFYLDSLNTFVKNNGGHFVGGKLSLADIVYTSYSGFLSTILGHDMNKDHPELKQLVDKVLALPNIKAYVAKRPKTVM